MPRSTAARLLVLLVVGAGALAEPAGAVLPHDTQSRPPLTAGVVVAPRPVSAPAQSPTQAGLLRTGSAQADAGLPLADRVRNALNRSGATTVAAAVDVEGLGEVLRMDAAHLLPPASTQKSFVSSAALLALTPGYRWRTEVAARTTPTAGRLPGGVWLVGGGDPYLTRTGLRSLARTVRAAGITYVTGDLLLDDSRYDARRTVDGWKSDYVPEESGPLSSLAVDGNAFRTDRAFLSDPAVPIAQLFRDALKAEGVVVHGVIRRHRRPAEARTLGAVTSGPASDVVRRMMKGSDNFAAELILKEVGRAVRGTGSSAAGVAAMTDLLTAQGVPVGPGTDGSGLSARNRQHARGQLLLLQAAARDPAVGPALRRSLPIACRDGTLERRMCNSAASGRLQAKTGTLPGVRTLAGYTTTASGRAVQFAFVLTGVQSGTSARSALDAAGIVLASATE